MRGIMQSGPRPFRARQALPVIFAALLVSGAAVLPAAARSGSAAELTSPLGSYLAGRVARGENDTADAAIFYRHALARSPNDARILERSFLVEAAEGNTRRTIALAKKLVKYLKLKYTDQCEDQVTAYCDRMADSRSCKNTMMQTCEDDRSLEQMLALYDNLSPAQKKRVLAMADEMSPSIDWQQATRILSDIIQLIALGA